MANARIEIKIGSIEFISEGEQDWVTEQLDKILEKAQNLENNIVKEIATANPQKEVIPTDTHPTDLFSAPKSQRVIPENLSTFLRKKDAVDKQRRKFLGAAVWLQLNGQQITKTKEVTDALRNARQVKITNPSHQLNQNIAQGYCQKEGRGFYVTPQGVESIM